MKIQTLTLLFSLSLPGIAAGGDLDLSDETVRINYSLGYQIGGDFKRQGVDMNAAAVVRGIQDALKGADPLMAPKEMHATLVELKRSVVARQQAGKRQSELKYLAEGKEFLEKNAKQPGVVTTDSGLQYRIVQEGNGKRPGPMDEVTVQYRGSLVNGQEFDSSYSRGKPATFRLNGVIRGWTEGLQKVREGGKVQLVIPPELAYGERGPLAHRTLVFDVELISVGPAQNAAAGIGEQMAKKP